MSFILDALRKSEHARQKQSGPGFAEVPLRSAKPRTNAWATAAVALLVVNLLAVGVVLLRRGAEDRSAPATNTPAAPLATPDAAPAPSNAPTTQSAPSAKAPGSAGPTLAPPSGVRQSGALARPRDPDSGRNPLADEVGSGDASGLEPPLAAAAAAVPEGPRAVTRQPAAPARRGSVVYAPIPEASDAPYSPPAVIGREPAPTAGNALPSADEMTARGGLPALHLDLHVYSSVPQQRFIFVNSRKYREGDALQEGPVVEQITSRGAVLSYHGSRFQLSND